MSSATALMVLVFIVNSLKILGTGRIAEDYADLER